MYMEDLEREDGIRTRDIDLGKVRLLYQLSYSRALETLILSRNASRLSNARRSLVEKRQMHRYAAKPLVC